MDVVCINCGEPWDVYHVLHEEPENFVRTGGVIQACPHCKGEKQKLSEPQRTRLDEIAALAELLGDDIDGFAATLEDFGLV